jgi:predicted nucleic acid-binding protein
VTAVDTSVVVAAFASWHEGHAVALEALARRPKLPAHVALESFSVLTRLPPPHRVPPAVASEFLSASFSGVLLVLPARSYLELVAVVTRAGLAGGAIYDALVGATAKHAGATLLTRDRRALITYEAVGVRHELLG